MTPLITAEQLAEETFAGAITTDYVYRQCRARLWEHTRIGRRVLFSEDQVRRIVAACAQPAITPGVALMRPRRIA